MKTFLESDEVRRLTGRAWRSKQIAALRRMGVPFRVNDAGEIIVARVHIEGREDQRVEEPKPKWQPANA